MMMHGLANLNASIRNFCVRKCGVFVYTHKVLFLLTRENLRKFGLIERRHCQTQHVVVQLCLEVFLFS